MRDLAQYELDEYYGYDHDHDFKPNFKNWMAVLWTNDREPRYCIAPKVFWRSNHCVPDWCVGFTIPGFHEDQEHSLKSRNNAPLNEQKRQLEELGFEVLDDADWGG